MLRGGHELQRCSVYAVSQTGRLRTILKDMALVAFTAGTMNFGARENQLEVGARLDHFRVDRLPETRPTGAAVKLMLG